MQFIQVIHKCGIQRLYEDILRGDLFFLKERKKKRFSCTSTNNCKETRVYMYSKVSQNVVSVKLKDFQWIIDL